MNYQTGSIRQTLQRLHAEGYCVSENALRTWVKSGQIPASYCGKRAYVYYPNVLAFLKAGTTAQKEPLTGIRRIG